MSKPTMADRAAAYVREEMLNYKTAWWLPGHLAAFAASEVARVREEQAMPLAGLRGHERGCARCAEDVEAIDAATRAPKRKASK